MPPPRNHQQHQHSPPDAYEHEYAIRALTAAVEKLTDKAEELEHEFRKLRDAQLEWKTKWAVFTALGAIVLGIAMKFLPLHL